MGSTRVFGVSYRIVGGVLIKTPLIFLVLHRDPILLGIQNQGFLIRVLHTTSVDTLPPQKTYEPW